MIKNAFRSAAIAALCLGLMALPASGFLTGEDEYEQTPCVDDGNNTSAEATEIGAMWASRDSVCEDDYFDWYHFQGRGEIDWTGNVNVYADAPGLVARLYFDAGGGLTAVREMGVHYDSNSEGYRLEIELESACLDAGFPPPLNGDFYIRIFYYSAFPGEHPYTMVFIAAPHPTLPGGSNSRMNATAIPIGVSLNGTLTQTDFYEWYTWEHPAGQPVDGFIELSAFQLWYFDEKPDIKLSLFNSWGSLLTASTISGEERHTYIDLEPLALNPGCYYLHVQLTQAVNNPIVYRLHNRATCGIADGFGADANEDAQYAVLITADSPAADTICHPRDHADYYRYESDTYFIGDILLLPWSKHGLYVADIYQWGKECNSSPGSSIQCESFFCRPIRPGPIDIVIKDFYPGAPSKPYQIEIVRDGAGPYRAPGHSNWQTAHDMFTGWNYTATYWFELEPGQQDQYCFAASPGADIYLVGIIEIYGSRPDYTLRVGELGAGGPVWAPMPILPEANGRTVLDIGYQIFAEPGSHIMRIKLDPSVTGRRRFFVEQDVYILDCFEEVPDDLNHPATHVSAAGDEYRLIGSLCPPDDMVDCGEIHIKQSDEFGVPSGYVMTVKAGYPGMEFRLYDSSHNEIWSQQIAELGGIAMVGLETLVQAGEDYVLKVSVESTEERLMMWEAKFAMPLFAPLSIELVRPIFRPIDVPWV